MNFVSFRRVAGSIGGARLTFMLALALGAGLLSSCGGDDSSSGRLAALPNIHHVFIIVLENKSYDDVFGAGSQAPYLSKTLTAQGALLTHYFATGHRSTTNYVALVSGQAPNEDTQGDCSRYSDFVGTAVNASGQAVGNGCVYPASVLTIVDQLRETGRTWKGYMEDMGNDPNRESAACGHPPIGQSDNTQNAQGVPLDQYAMHHNPFVYFHSLLDSGDCAQHDVSLAGFASDLQSVSSTPNYVFITPNMCNDGHDQPCVNGAQGGLKQADQFLQGVVPAILASPAYRQDGLLMILFDETDYDASGDDASACCNEPTGPNTSRPGITGPGGGRTGAVLISPFITPGTVVNAPYNHYSTLRTVEDVFGVPHLGFASSAPRFGGDVFAAE